MFDDIGVGYFLMRGVPNQVVSAVVPTVEVHLNTPLNHRGSLDNPVCTADSLDGILRNADVDVAEERPEIGTSARV
jgi:hypothetical protein